jgi:RNA polymerase sigma factor (TIGR02999 family)
MNDASRLLEAASAGDAQAADQLLPLVYAELRRLAAAQLAREKPGQTLDATALVHEAYLRLVGSDGSRRWQGCRHFLAAAAEAMRRILVDTARRKAAAIHGGGRTRLHLDAQKLAAPQAAADLLALDEALTRFSEVDPTAAELVKLRCFTGLTLPEAARALDMAPRSADRLWAYARAWLRAELAGK